MQGEANRVREGQGQRQARLNLINIVVLYKGSDDFNNTAPLARSRELLLVFRNNFPLR